MDKETSSQKTETVINAWLDDLNQQIYDFVINTDKDLFDITRAISERTSELLSKNPTLSTLINSLNFQILANSPIKPWKSRSTLSIAKELLKRAKKRAQTPEHLTKTEKLQLMSRVCSERASYEITRLLLRDIYGNTGFGSGNCTAIPMQTLLMHGRNSPYKFLIHNPLQHLSNAGIQLPANMMDTIREHKLRWLYQQLGLQDKPEHVEIKDELQNFAKNGNNMNRAMAVQAIKSIEDKLSNQRLSDKQPGADNFPLKHLLGDFMSLLPNETRALDLNKPNTPNNTRTDRYLNLANPTQFVRKLLDVQTKIENMQKLFQDLPQDDEILQKEIGDIAHKTQTQEPTSALAQLLDLLPHEWPNKSNPLDLNKPDIVVSEIRKLEQKFGHLKKFVHQTDDKHNFAQIFAEHNISKGAPVVIVPKPAKADANAPYSPKGLSGGHMIVCSGFEQQPNGTKEPQYISFDYEKKDHILSPQKQCGYVVDMPYLIQTAYEIYPNLAERLQQNKLQSILSKTPPNQPPHGPQLDPRD